ncbi:MAG: pyruvate dehydrogenase [Bdellovibrionota bacterium]
MADPKKKANPAQIPDVELLNRIARRALYYSTQMIHLANNRPDVQKGDPKVGGHPAACASTTHLMAALHLLVREPQDYFAIKPHASPMDHSYSHLLGLFSHKDGQPFNEEEAKKVMHRLRAFMDPHDPDHEPAFQSYHAVWDPDSFNYFPSGSVGIPPVVSAYTALAYRFAEKHDFAVPKNAHFWSIIGDSEFREGSLAECMPDIAERELGNVTWIVDYNRQNLDGTRIINEEGIRGTDADRIEKMAVANGWNVIQLRHGRKRESFFTKTGNDVLQKLIEGLADFELQALLLKRDGKVIRTRFIELAPSLRNKLLRFTDAEMVEFLEDLGGHDIDVITEALRSCRTSKKPTLIVAHTIKGWGLQCQAMTGNHSMLADPEEIDAMRKAEKVAENDLFQLFSASSEEAKYCKQRGQYLRKGIDAQRELKQKNAAKAKQQLEQSGGFPTQFGVNLKLAPWANTQWMWGQLAAKLIRIANAVTGSSKNETLTDDEKKWAVAAPYVVTMAPDVGTSTNLNPSMDGKIFGPDWTVDFEARYEVKDKRRPDLVPLEKEANRHLRFEIEEGNAMSCAGAFGKMLDHIGVPFLPLMTIYDFFIKRALDQFFYNVYWQSGFILVGTPSGVTLSPEGAQHSWKSDLQIPNGITWEPTFSLEMDWIIADAVRRHFTGENTNREGVLIRAVTRGIEQKTMLDRLKRQLRFQGMSDEEVLEHTRQDVLQGGYWLVNYEGHEGYAPGDNVVHIFAMGALGVEAVQASDKLLEQGIYANVILVTSPDLLIGTLGRETGYQHLKQNLGVNANLHLNRATTIPVGAINVNGNGSQHRLELSTRADLLSLRGSRIPVVAVCDGEPGLLDNIGSIVGVPQDTLAVRKHSKSGRPVDVYQYHHIDPASIAETAVAMLEQAASEEIVVSRSALNEVAETEGEASAAEDYSAEEESPPTRH